MKTGLVKSGNVYTKTYVDPATGSERHDKKAKARYRIQKEVNPGEEYDVFDIIADLAKRLNILERGMVLLMDDMRANGHLPQVILDNYSQMIDGYLGALGTGQYKARTDLASDNNATFTELMRRDNAVTEILAECGYNELAE